MSLKNEKPATFAQPTVAAAWCVFDLQLHVPGYPTSIRNAKPEVGI
jgi:hypothetical protein